jgi:hypothetical protein
MPRFRSHPTSCEDHLYRKGEDAMWKSFLRIDAEPKRRIAVRRLILGLCLIPAMSVAQVSKKIELAPRSGPMVRRWTHGPLREPVLSHEEKLRLLREHIKHVFVLFQENRSFDFYFGTYPGADGLFSRPASEIAGFTQPIVNVDGTISNISPFRVPSSVVDVNGRKVSIYPTDLASVNHSHVGLAGKLDLDSDGVARNDRYAVTEEGVTLVDGRPSKSPSLERKQFGELVMSHIDCDAAPFLWQYADRFTLFDHFFDTVVGPSGPNAIAMIAGQTGETEWMLHPELADGKNGTALPLVSNARPYWGLPLDVAGNPAAPKPTLHQILPLQPCRFRLWGRSSIRRRRRITTRPSICSTFKRTFGRSPDMACLPSTGDGINKATITSRATPRGLRATRIM